MKLRIKERIDVVLTGQKKKIFLKEKIRNVKKKMKQSGIELHLEHRKGIPH